MPRKQTAAAAGRARRRRLLQAVRLCRLRPAAGRTPRCAQCQDAVYCSKKCQTRAWKAGHKRECVPAEGMLRGPERRDTQQAASPSKMLTDQRHLLTRLNELQARPTAYDWRVVLAPEHARGDGTGTGPEGDTFHPGGCDHPNRFPDLGLCYLPRYSTSILEREREKRER